MEACAENQQTRTCSRRRGRWALVGSFPSLRRGAHRRGTCTLHARFPAARALRLARLHPVARPLPTGRSSSTARSRASLVAASSGSPLSRLSPGSVRSLAPWLPAAAGLASLLDGDDSAQGPGDEAIERLERAEIARAQAESDAAEGARRLEVARQQFAEYATSKADEAKAGREDPLPPRLLLGRPAAPRATSAPEAAAEDPAAVLASLARLRRTPRWRPPRWPRRPSGGGEQAKAKGRRRRRRRNHRRRRRIRGSLRSLRGSLRRHHD